MKYCLEYFFLTCIVFAFFSNPVFSAQVITVTQNKVQEQIKAVEETKEMDEKVKANLLDVYGKTLNHLEAIKTNNQQSKAFDNARKKAPEEIKQLQLKLTLLESEEEQRKLKPEIQQSSEQILAEIKKIPSEELEQKLNSESANLAAVTAKNNDLEQTLNQEINSASGIQKRIIEANNVLEQRQEDKKLSPSEENVEVSKAEQWLLDAQIESLRSEIKMLDQKLLSQPLRLKVLRLKKDLSDFNLKKLSRTVQQLKQQLDLKRNSDIEKTQEKTRTEQNEAQGKHPLIQSLAQENTLLTEVITQRTRELIELETLDDSVFKETQRIKEEHANTRQKLEIAGLNQILGQQLWDQKKALPDSRQYINNLEKREHVMAQLGLERLHYQEQLNKIKDRDFYLSELLVEIPLETKAVIQEDLIKLIKTRKTLLEKVLTIDEKHLKATGELDMAEKKLLEVASSYRKLLSEQLFWLRSATFLSWNDFENSPEQIQFFLHPYRWLKFVRDFFTKSQHTYKIIPGLVFFLFLLFKRARIKDLLINTGRKTKKISTDSLLHTWEAIFYTLLLSIPIPILLWIGGWKLVNTPDVSPFSLGVADGMLRIALPLFCLNLFRTMCLPGGLFEVHFKWSDELIKGLRKEMGRLMLTFLPILFIASLLISRGEASLNGGLSRLFLLLILMTFALFHYRLLKPDTGFLSSVAQRNPHSFLAKYQTLLFVSGLLFVAALMGLTIVGFVYTAVEMTLRLIDSVWFIFALVILQQSLTRWLLLTRRRYALKMAYEKRQEAQALKQQESLHDAEDEVGIEIEEPEIDMVSLSKDSRKLLNLALFIITVFGYIFIWSEVFPALAIFENVTLWHHQGIVDGVEKLVPVSLSDLALALLILFLTLVGAKRFPAIIEIVLLQYSTVSSGDRYTVTTLANYTIIGVGFFAVFNIMGGDWNRFQWLFAALSVGIGFGLQEIVANFISGLIILFERPIRVGDFISVGENEGVVSRIQIRATTIITYDRKELLVPNKEFITGQLVNLSLSDPIARISIPIGVAYGSDIPRAKDLLLEAAEENEQVLNEPKPNVIFHSFGDNSLNLQLRSFVEDVDARMRTISELNEAINEKFNSAGICIAFPQRDVHLDISQPIDVRVQGKSE
ncbi:MAG: mechanosensitive ion channel [Gammaproteobacteria bacterium]|nr:mechanosensitive ion channel [Gammaproteobacteria bacterium]